MKNYYISRSLTETENIISWKEDDLIMVKDKVVARTSLCKILDTKCEELENAITDLADKLTQRDVDLHDDEVYITDLQFDRAEPNARNDKYKMRADNIDGDFIFRNLL